ncbi:unnamed protein product [Choristocarpus tenellus]
MVADDAHVCPRRVYFNVNVSELLLAPHPPLLVKIDPSKVAENPLMESARLRIDLLLRKHETVSKLLEGYQSKQGITLSGNLASTECIGCAKGIRIRDPVPKSTTARARGPFTRIFIDLTGPKKVKSLGGAEYALAIVDGSTHFIWIRLLQKKSYAEKALRRWFKSEVIPSGRHIQYIRHDPWGEWQSEEFQDLVMEMGTVQEMNRTGEPQYNGVIKHRIAQVDSAARTSIYSAGLENKMWLWGEKYNHSAYILNRSTTVANKGTIPYRALYREIGSLVNVSTFGTPGYYKSSPGNKLGSRGQQCIMVGISDNQVRGTFRVLDLTTKRVIQRANIHWHPTTDGRVRFPISDLDRDHEDLDDTPGYILPPHSRRTREIQEMGGECDDDGITWIEGGLGDSDEYDDTWGSGELVEETEDSNDDDDDGVDEAKDSQCERET